MNKKWYPKIIYLSLHDFNQRIQIDIHQIQTQVQNDHLEDTQAESLTQIKGSVQNKQRVQTL